MKKVTENVINVTSKNVLNVTSNLRQLIRIIPGAPPGQIQHLEDTETKPIAFKACTYGDKTAQDRTVSSPKDLPMKQAENELGFVIVEGMQNTRAIQQVCRQCGLHDLEIEDILNTRHRPKIEFHDDHVFVLFRILSDDMPTLKYEHCAMIVHKEYVILIREHSDDQFVPIFERIKNPESRFHTHGTDYLAYAILDLAIDRMNVTHSTVQTDCFQLEETYLENSSDQTLYAIKTLHRKVIALIRTSGPTREMIQQMINHDQSPLKGDTVRFMADVLDHVVQSHEQSLHLRDLVTGMISLHLSNIGQTTNEIMKFITIMGSVFIPLTFIAGIYGMNFDVMPELRWEYGYHAVWGLMLTTAAGLLLYFRRRGWF